MANVGSVEGRIELQDAFSGALDKFTTGIGIAMGDRFVGMVQNAIGAVTGMASELINTSDAVTNTSQAFGIGVEALQKFKVAGAAVGVSSEMIAMGLRRLQTSLAKNSEETANAVKFLGLGMADLKQMAPEKQLQTILEKVQQIPNAMDRTAVATALLGRAGAMLVPLGAGLGDIMKKAEDLGIVMSKNTVKAADDLGDSLGLLEMTMTGVKNNFVSVLVESEPLHVMIEGLTDIFGQLSMWVRQNQDDLRAYVDGGIVFLVSAMSNAISVVEVALAVFKALADIWVIGKGAAIEAAAAAQLLASALANPGDISGAWKTYQDTISGMGKTLKQELDANQASLDKAIGVTTKIQDAFDNLGKKVAATVGVHHAAADATDKFSASTFKSAEASKAAADAAAKLQAEIQKLKDTFTGAAAIADVDKIALAFVQLFSEGKASQQALNAALTELNKLGAVGRDTAEALRSQWEEANGVIALFQHNVSLAAGAVAGMSTTAAQQAEAYVKGLQKDESGQIELNKEIMKTAVALHNMGEISDAVFDKIVHDLGVASGAARESAKTFKQAFGESMKELPQAILAAIQGGGDVFKTIGGKIGGDLATAIAPAVTKGLSGLLGKGLGSALGSVIPGLGTVIGGLLGDLGGKLIGKLFGGEVKKVNDIRDAFFAAAGGFEALAQKLAITGNSDLVKKIFDAKTVDQFNAAVLETQKALDFQLVAQNEVNAAIEKYGFTVDELGPRMAQQKLDETFQVLFKDWEVLNAAGIDHEAIINRMSPAINEYVNAAVKAGGTIPKAFAPVIDQLFAEGKLVHENGEAYTEAEKNALKFGETIEESMKRAVDEIKRLVDAILGIGKVKVPAIHVPVTVGDPEEGNNGNNGGGGPGNHPQGASIGHGLGLFTPTANDASASTGDSGGPSTMHFHLSLAGDHFDDIIMKRTRAGYIRVG